MINPMKTSQTPVRELFGFVREPFQPVPADIWLDDQRNETVELLHALVARRGFGVLTGAAGCGKTILLGQLSSRLGSNTHQVVYIACAECGPSDLLRLIGLGLGLEPTLGKSRMIRRIHDRVAELKGITPVLIVDEAQGLPQSTLETLRVTCSAGLQGKNRFAVIIAGAEELLGRLSLRVFEPLRQRLTVYAELTALNREQTGHYLRHRLESAGGPPELFNPETVNFLFEVTNGVPRRIDKLADEALRRAARSRSTVVMLEHVQAGARTVFGPTAETRS